jgi:hypothetical protein
MLSFFLAAIYQVSLVLSSRARQFYQIEEMHPLDMA